MSLDRKANPRVDICELLDRCPKLQKFSVVLGKTYTGGQLCHIGMDMTNRLLLAESLSFDRANLMLNVLAPCAALVDLRLHRCLNNE